MCLWQMYCEESVHLSECNNRTLPRCAEFCGCHSNANVVDDSTKDPDVCIIAVIQNNTSTVLQSAKHNKSGE